MGVTMKNIFLISRCIVILTVFGQVFSIYTPNAMEQTQRPYTTGVKIKTSHYKTSSHPYYHSSYSKVYVQHKNYTSSLLDSAGQNTSSLSNGQSTKLYPVYMSEEKKEKIRNILQEHNTNVVEKDTLNNRVVIKRRIEKSKSIEVYNKCPEGVTGQFVYDFACNQYLDCWKGRGGPRNCAPGTLFNPKTLECDFPEKVECITGTSVRSLTLQKSAKYENYEQAKCPEGFSGLIPNYTDCTKFIQCNSGIQTPGTCPPGTLFDTKLNVCNHPRETICFSGQSGKRYVVKEQYGGSTDGTSDYQGNVGQTGQYQGQRGQYGKQTGYFSGQSNYLGQGQSHDITYNKQYYPAGGQFQGGSTPSGISSHSTLAGTQYYGGSIQTGCDRTNQTCQPSVGSYNQASLGQGGNVGEQIQGSSGTVYIQFVMCNPAVEDCSNFHQGTFVLGAGGALCNPLNQQCIIPSTRVPGQTRQNILPSSGTHFVKYVTCNPSQEDCSQYQKGTIEATYGVPGTPIGVQPVQGSFQGTGVGNTPAVCNPQIYNCDTIQYKGQNRPQITTYDQIATVQGQSGQTCNPQFRNCAQNITETKYYGKGYSATDSPGRYPKKFDSSKNYQKICTAGDVNCYQAGSTVPTKTYGIHDSSDNKPKCPDGFQGITKHPSDCKKFLNCANGITYVQDCAPGTLFNPTLSICDFPYNVDCKKDTDGAETTTQHHDFDPIVYQGQQKPYERNEDGSQVQGGCRGSQCSQGQFQGTGSQQSGCQGSQCVYIPQGQGQGQGQTQGQYESNYGQQQVQGGCQGVQCSQGQFGYGQGQFQVPGSQQNGCQGSQCVYRPKGQGQGQVQDQFGSNYGQQQSQGGCQGSQCDYRPQGKTTYYGYSTPPPQGSSTNYQNHAKCLGQQCVSNQGQKFQGQYPIDGEYQVDSTTLPTNSWSTGNTKGRGSQGQTTGSGSSNQEGHVVIPSKTGYSKVTPINKFDRSTYGGFNNQKSVDYVDIFDPDESRNFAYATTTQKPKKEVWPPPFPDLATTDPNADYVFEYEDGEPVTLAPEKVNSQKTKKTRCDDNDFVCDKKSCIEKSLVCDGVKDCVDGKDEKYCQTYLDEFKPYNNSRLDVLERQRWDNVSRSTCALLCMDSQKFECKSFNYRRLDRACFLTNENVGSSGALKKFYPCDYYERTSLSMDCSDMHKCPNGKCLASEEVCDGYNDCGDMADEKGCRAEDFGYRVRLAGGEEESEGRVEVTVFGKTGYVCDDQFSITDADVLCKELGFYLGALEVKGNSYYAKELKENHTVYMMDDIECFGNESSIMHCNFAGWGVHNCADKEIAGVICKTPEESCQEGFWKCDSGNECVKMPFLCDDLNDCTDNSDEASHHCDSPTELRLINGTKENEGRLEIRHHGIWGSICDDDFNEDAAKIVCRYLGYSGSAYIKKDAHFGKSSGPIWLDQVSCYGNESSIENCTHWNWGEHNCDHSEDVGVICSNEFRVVEAQRNFKAFGGGASSSIDNSETRYSPEPVSCGYRKDNIFLENDDVHFRVVEGSVAKPGDYPWQAALRINGQGKTAHWCGAVVISSKWVLSAAHCLQGYPKGAYIVVAGEYNMDEVEGTEQQAFIDEYYIHEDFRKRHKMGNDIAMIKLKGHGFKLNQDIQPICLPDETSDYERELNCTISGFGTIETGKSVFSHKLRATWIPVQKMDVCRMAHVYGNAIGEGMFCAGVLNGGGDACDGDSGGPLACLQDGVFTLYGLTSWGQRCGVANKPGVYVKVSYYKKWIETIMKLHS